MVHHHKRTGLVLSADDTSFLCSYKQKYMADSISDDSNQQSEVDDGMDSETSEAFKAEQKCRRSGATATATPPQKSPRRSTRKQSKINQETK
jgi:hypothetical protein